MKKEVKHERLFFIYRAMFGKSVVRLMSELECKPFCNMLTKEIIYLSLKKDPLNGNLFTQSKKFHPSIKEQL